MIFEQNLNQPARALYLIVGLALIIFAGLAGGGSAGIPDALIIMVGALTLLAGLSGRCLACRVLGINLRKKTS